MKGRAHGVSQADLGTTIFAVVLLLSPTVTAAGAGLPGGATTAASFLPFPSADAFVADHEAAYGMSDPTHGRAHGVNPAAVDIASGATASANPGPEPSLLWALDDPAALHLRLRLGDTPVHPGGSGALYKSWHWGFLLDPDGDGLSEFVIDIFGGDRHATAATPRYKTGSVVVFNHHGCEERPTGDLQEDHGVTPLDAIWGRPASKASNAHTKATVLPSGQAFLDVAIPWDVFTYRIGACAGQRALTPGAPFGLFAATSASNTDPLQKDWMAGAVLAPRLVAEKTATPTRASPGDDVHFRIDVRNLGSGTARDARVADTLPAHMSLLDARGGLYDPGTRTVTWALPALLPGGNASVSLVLRIDDDVPASVSVLENVALVTDEDPATPPVASDPAPVEVERHVALALSIEPGAETVGPGALVPFVVRVANTGRQTATDVTIDVALDGPVSPASFMLDIGALAPGEAGVYPVHPRAASVLDAGVHPVHATARLAAREVPDLTAGPAVVRIVAGAALHIDHAADKATAGPGETVGFDVAYANLGDGTATDALLAWSAPPGVEVVSASGGGAIDGDTVLWGLGDVPAGGAGGFHVVVRVLPAPEGESDAEASAVVSADGTPPAAATAGFRIVARALVALTGDVAPGVTRPGRSLAYTFTYTNGGTATTDELLLTVRLEGPVDPVGASDDGVLEGGSATWRVAPLPPGASGTVVLDARARALVPEGSHAAIARGTIHQATANVTAAVVAEATLTLRSTATPAVAKPGDVVNWTLTWHNAGDGVSPPLDLFDEAPARTTVQDVSEGGRPLTPNVLWWRLAPVLPGETGTAWFTARVDPVMPAGTTILADDATLEGAASGLLEASSQVLVEAAPRLVVTLAPERPGAGPGDALRFHGTVENVGDADAVGVTVLPSLEGPAVAGGASHPAFDLPVGGSVAFVFDAVADDILVHGDHDVVATARAIADHASEASSDPARVVLVARAVLDLQDAVAPGRVRPGETATWTLTYRNLGNGTAPDVTLDASPPATLALEGADGAAVGPDGVLRWTIGQLPANAAGTRAFTLRVPPVMPAGTTAHADGARLEAPTVGTAVASATLLVDAAPALDVRVDVTPTRAYAGDLLVYTIVVRNVGDAPAASVSLIDALPPLTRMVDASAGGGYDAATGAVRWALPGLAPGGSHVATLTLRVAPVLPEGETPIDDVASAQTPEGASAVSNVARVIVVGAPELLVTKVASATAVLEGGAIRYLVTVVNVGSSDARGVVIVDELPEHHRVVSVAPASALVAGRTVTLGVPLLAAAGGVATLDILAQIHGVEGETRRVCNVAVVTAANVALPVASPAVCVDLSCPKPAPVQGYASAATSPGLGILGTEAIRDTPGTTAVGHEQAGSPLPLDARVAKQTSSVTFDPSPTGSRAKATLRLVDVTLLDGRIHADLIEVVLEGHVDGDEANWTTKGTRFLNLTIDGRTYADLAPNTIVALDRGYVVVGETIASTKAPTQGITGDPARRLSVDVTSLRVVLDPTDGLVASDPNDLRVGHASIDIVHAVEPQCQQTPRPTALLATAGVAHVGPVRAEEVTVWAGTGFDERYLKLDAPSVEARSAHVLARTLDQGEATFARAETHVGPFRLHDGLVEADGLHVEIQQGIGGDVSVATSFVSLRVAGVPIRSDVAPNTKVLIPGVGFVMLNEQTSPGGQGVSVRMVRVVAPGPATEFGYAAVLVAPGLGT